MPHQYFCKFLMNSLKFRRNGCHLLIQYKYLNMYNISLVVCGMLD